MLKIRPIVIRFGSVLRECVYIDGNHVRCLMNRALFKGQRSIICEEDWKCYNSRTAAYVTDEIDTRGVSELVTNDIGQTILALSANPQISAEHIYQNLKLLGLQLNSIKFVRTHAGGLLIFKSDREITLEEFIIHVGGVERVK